MPDKQNTPFPASQMKHIFAMLSLLTSISGYFSFQGAQLILGDLIGTDAHTDIYTRFGPLVYAVGSSVALYLLWQIAFKVVPWVSSEQIIPALLGVMLICIASIGLSSWVNVAWMAGGAAYSSHTKERIQTARTVLDETIRQIRRVAALAPEIQRHSNRFARMAQEDRAEGTHTGHPGGGSFVDAANTIAIELSTISNDLEKSTRQAEDIAYRAEKTTQTMRQIIASHPGSPTDKLTQVTEQIDLLRTALAEMNATAIADNISRALTYISALSANMTHTSQNKSVAAGQAKAIATLQQRVKDVTEPLSKAVLELGALDVSQKLVFKDLSVTNAVFTYADQFVPQWIGSLALDLAPVLVLFFLRLQVLMIRRRKDKDHPDAPAPTLPDLLNAIKASTELIKEAQGISALTQSAQQNLPAPSQTTENHLTSKTPILTTDITPPLGDILAQGETHRTKKGTKR